MKRKITITGIVVLMLVSNFIFAQKNKLMYDKLVNYTQNGFYTVPIGLCEDYPEETTTMDIIRSDFELLKKYDVKFLRISFGWDAIESEKDKYDWLFWDDFVRMAVEDYGITLIPYICYTPDWNSTGKGDPMKFWNHTPVNYEEFGQFMTDLVNRYKKWIKSWELWNEPDIKAFWSGTSAELAKLTKIGSKSVRKADPEAIVVLAGLAHRVEFTRELFRDHGISPFVDVVNIHNYFETWHPSNVEKITEYVNEISSIVDEYGDGQPVWMAEVGYSTWRMTENKVSNDYTAYYDYEHTPEYQAVDLFKRCALVAATGKVSAIAWYEIKDLPQVEDVIGDNNNRNLGIAYIDHTPKPAATSLQFFNKLFAQPFRSINEKIKIKKKAESESHVLVFENKDGSATVVAWLQTSNPDKRDNDSSGKVNDKRQEKIDITLPLNLSNNATLYDELGNSKTFNSVKSNQQSTELTDISLKGGKLTVLHIEK